MKIGWLTKEPIGGDRYRISADLFCQSMLGCSPKKIDVRKALLYYVKTGEDLIAGKVQRRRDSVAHVSGEID